MNDIQVRRKRKSIVRGSRYIPVSPDKFCKLAISRDKLDRVDDGTDGVRGLHDSRTGNVFVVDAVELMMWMVRKA